MHRVGENGAVWYGGMGHKLISTEANEIGEQGVWCYRCGMSAEPDAFQELIPDCQGPEHGGDHHWQVGGDRLNECAYGDARMGPSSAYADGMGQCQHA